MRKIELDKFGDACVKYGHEIPKIVEYMERDMVAWTEEDNENLLQGYLKYGLNFEHISVMTFNFKRSPISCRNQALKINLTEHKQSVVNRSNNLSDLIDSK